jgi:integrase/DNA-binding transcriptional regulator YhcF (GntR family)
VRVYAGQDRLTRKRNYLTEVVPPGPDAEDEADKVLRRLLVTVDENKHPKTKATVSQVVNAHVPYMKVAESTRRTLIRYADKHIHPVIGSYPAQLGAHDLDRYYAELGRCRDHCTRPFIQHRTRQRHTCDARCAPHECKPLADWTIRKIHFFLSGAYERVRRWEWVTINPMTLADPPSAPHPDPQPPTPDEAARILNAAWHDVFFGTLVWVAFTTSPRRAELCGLRWKHFDPKRKVLYFHRNTVQDGAELWEKDTKSGQRRHIALDDQTTALLIDYRAYCEEVATALGLTITEESFIFSLKPDGSEPYKPRTLTQRYNRLAERLGIDTTIRRVRHYSATELIVAGVDIRTVAGRLGHSGGGTTTLKIYAAWVTEADQRASKVLLEHVPPRPADRVAPAERAKTTPTAPYEEIASAVRNQILTGALADGAIAPSVKDIAKRFSVSTGTAHRALGLLRTWGMLSGVGRGVRPRVINTGETVNDIEREPADQTQHTDEPIYTDPPEVLNLTLLRCGEPMHSFTAEAKADDPAQLRRLLLGAIKRRGDAGDDTDDYELEVRRGGSSDLVTTYVAL